MFFCPVIGRADKCPAETLKWAEMFAIATFQGLAKVPMQYEVEM
jgi:hypothetical protein